MSDSGWQVQAGLPAQQHGLSGVLRAQGWCTLAGIPVVLVMMDGNASIIAALVCVIWCLVWQAAAVGVDSAIYAARQSREVLQLLAENDRRIKAIAEATEALTEATEALTEASAKTDRKLEAVRNVVVSTATSA